MSDEVEVTEGVEGYTVETHLPVVYPCAIKAKKNDNMLVEFKEANGNICRTWVPGDTIEERGSLTYVTDPHMGIPFGVRFSEHLAHLGDVAQDIEQALRVYGIWTWQDVTNRTDLVKRAYADVLGLRTHDLVALAVKQQKSQ